MYSLIQIALRNVLRNQRRSIITLFAVFLALTVMVGVKGLLNGLQASIIDAIVQGQIGAVQVHKKGFLRSIQASPLELDFAVDDAFLKKLRSIPHVVAVAPRIPFGGMVNDNDTTVFALFFGVDPVEEVKVCPKRFEKLGSGVPVSAANPTGADLTSLLQNRIGAKEGEVVAILTGDREGVMNAVEIKVAGTFSDAGVLAAEKKYAALPLSVAQELLRMPGRATELAIGVDDLKNVDEVAASLRAVLGDGYEVSTWHDLANFIDDIIKNQNAVLGWISNTFLFVALLGIANTMLMSVRERTREIGTMMAVGVRRRQILALFLLEAAFIGLAGGFFGTMAGGYFVYHYGQVGMHIKAMGQSAVLELHPYITAAFILRVYVIAAVGASLAALYPAFRASRLRPVEALSTAA